MMEPVYALHWLLAFGMEGMNSLSTSFTGCFDYEDGNILHL